MNAQPIPADLLRSIRRLAIRTNRLATDVFIGNYRSAFKGQGMEFEEFREYMEGDDVRRIDWNVSARTQHPLIRLFREERELTVLLAVDRSGSGEWGSGNRSKRYRMAEVAALLAFSAVRNGDRAGLILFTDRVEKIVRPEKGQQHAMRLVRDILYHPCRGTATDLNAPLGALNRIFRRRAIVFLLTDFLANDYERALGITAARHDLVPIHTVDDRERVLPDAGWVAFVDSETGEHFEINTSDPAARAIFEREAMAQLLRVKERCRRARADVIQIDAEAPFEKALHRFFELRRLHRR